MWSQSRRLGLETTNVSTRSRLGQNPQRLGLGAVCLGLGPVGLVSGSRAIASHRDVLCRGSLCILYLQLEDTNQHDILWLSHISFPVFLLFHLPIYHKAELCHASLFSS